MTDAGMQAKSDAIAREAQRWHLRLKDASATELDRRQFDNWLGLDPAHEHAYARAEQLWRDLRGPATALGADGRYRRDVRRTSGLHVTFALAASVAAFALVFWFHSPGFLDRALAGRSAAPGQQASVPLADGSSAYLDGDTAIDVDFTGDARRVKLVRGRAWFDVQHDSSRPFFVHAGEVDVRVVGTAFAVERRGSAVVVTVERGKVAVAGPGNATQLIAGQQLVLDGQTILGPENVSAETSLAWRRGLIVFDQASLETVAHELSRMGAGRIAIADESLRSLTISGVFQTGDWQAVLDSLQSGLNLHATRVPGVVTILHR